MLALRAPLVERVPSRVPFRARSRLVVRRVSASGASGASDGSAPRRPSIRAPPPADPTTGVPRSLFCFGLGYTSLGLVNVLKRAGWTVSGTCRDDSRAESLASAGIDAHVWRPDDHLRLDRDGVAALAAATHVLASVPPVADFDRDPVLTDARCVDVLARSENLRWLGYLSSTGVYGDKLGAWVDEDEPAEPSPRRASRDSTPNARGSSSRRDTPSHSKFSDWAAYTVPGGVYWTPSPRKPPRAREAASPPSPGASARENLEDTRVDATWQISSPRSARA